MDCVFVSLLRLVADALNDLAILLNLIAPLFPGVFLFIACFASLCRVSSIQRLIVTNVYWYYSP